MQGLLRHSASIWSGLGGLPYPTAGLDVIVYNSTYEDGGTTYLRTSKGIGIPKVGGTGLDTIWDFSVLNDIRFDKGCYVGNAYGLPATYNFPYVGIYYNATSEATRYYWKITDFGYAVILAQSLLVDNMFFLKAKATTNTSNVIATWDRLFIYSTALADNNLAKIKTYIGIQDDFYGDNLIPSASSDFETDGTAYYTTLRCNKAWDSVNKNIILTSTSISPTPLIYKNGLVPIGTYVRLDFKAKSPTLTSIPQGVKASNSVVGNNLNTELQDYYTETTTDNNTIGICYFSPLVIGDQIILDDIIFRIKYQNYYAA